MAEYEAELCLYKEQNHRSQVLSPKVMLLRADDVQMPSTKPHKGMNQEINPTVKEEPEEAQTQEITPDLSSVCVKRDKSSLLQQSEKTQREDTVLTHLHPEQDRGDTSDHAEDWGAPFSWSDIETEDGGDEKEAEGGDKDTDLVYEDPCHQVKIRDTSPAEPNYSLYSQINAAVDNEVTPGPAAGTQQKKYQCFVCKKRFKTKQAIQRHELIHMGAKPFSCPFCATTFTQKTHLQSHMRRHTGDKPFSCPTCNKAFAHKGNMQVHIRLHTGERPFCCSVCGKDFADSSSQKKHMKTHTKKAMRLKALML